MGDMAEDFRMLDKISSITREEKSKVFTKIIEELGGRYLTSETYRLGEYNCYTSKGFAMHKSNHGAKISLVKLLNEQFGTKLSSKEIRAKIDNVLAEAGITAVKG